MFTVLEKYKKCNALLFPLLLRNIFRYILLTLETNPGIQGCILINPSLCSVILSI